VQAKGAAALIVALLTSCAAEAGPRPQVVLYVDTDVEVPALADTLRVEVINPDGTSVETRTYIRPNVRDWPVSLGIAPREDGEPTMLRLRLFEASHIAGRNPTELTTILGLEPDDPLPAFAMDRLVEVRAPAEGTSHVQVILHGDCLGMLADVERRLTCVASSLDPRGPANAGLEILDGPPASDTPSRAGTWNMANERPCIGEPRTDSGLYDDEVCVSGGVFFMGDGRLGVNAAVGEAWASIPERLIRMSPFFMDRYEVTVGRVNAAIDRGFDLTVGEHHTYAESSFCTFRSDGEHDGLPMNCLTKELAEAFCAFDGGRALPSEAQWEYAASSRGEERLYVWGDRPATCDDAVFARVGPELAAAFGRPFADDLGRLGQCAHIGEWVQPVGSLPTDTTIDGVRDLGGNLQEWTRDSFIPLTSDCWADAYLVDPVCDVGPDTAYIVRGSIWSGVLGSLPVALRKGMTHDDAIGAGDTFSGFASGFRCVRPTP